MKNLIENWKKTLIDWAIQTKLSNLKRDGTVTHWFYDAVVFLEGALIDFPSDPCIPNTNSISVSASLAFEFL